MGVGLQFLSYLLLGFLLNKLLYKHSQFSYYIVGRKVYQSNFMLIITRL